MASAYCAQAVREWGQRSLRFDRGDTVKQSGQERRTEIVRLATTSGLASVEELSAAMGVTPSTIRRDLAKLTAQGKLARTYGGAISLVPTTELGLRQRLGEAYAAKRAIAAWCLTQILPGEVIALDAGSSVGALSEMLRGALRLTDLKVVAAGLTAIDALSESPHIEVTALGGRLRPMSQAFVGALAEESVMRLSFDRAFMSADAVHPDWGLCEAALEQTQLKSLIMSRANRTYVLAHSEKLGATPFHAWAPLPPMCVLVTDTGADPDTVAAFRARGVEVVLAPPIAESADPVGVSTA